MKSREVGHQLDRNKVVKIKKEIDSHKIQWLVRDSSQQISKVFNPINSA